MVCCNASSFFFFQAEDGIRDTSVTGVQTCALPISALRAGGEPVDRLRSQAGLVQVLLHAEALPGEGGECVRAVSRWLRHHGRDVRGVDAVPDGQVDDRADRPRGSRGAAVLAALGEVDRWPGQSEAGRYRGSPA